VLPILEKFNVERKLRGKRIRALILTPTRELAIQVEANVAKYSKYLNLSSMVMLVVTPFNLTLKIYRQFVGNL